MLYNVDVPALNSSDALPSGSRRVMMADEVAELVMSRRDAGVVLPIPKRYAIEEAPVVLVAVKLVPVIAPALVSANPPPSIADVHGV